MGHYQTIKFEAYLNDVGLAIIQSLYETHDWEETAEFFTEYKFVEKIAECKTNSVPFGPHPSWKPELSGSSFDAESRLWSVYTEWKYHGEQIAEVLEEVLPFMISEPMRFYTHHELWVDDAGKEKPHESLLVPVPPPAPDWDRKYGE